MSRKKHLLFVINPIAGGRDKSSLQRIIGRNLDRSLFHYEFAHTESEDHARRLSLSAAYLGFDIVAAVGGDGTVNEVARGIMARTGKQIPTGSASGKQGTGEQETASLAIKIGRASCRERGCQYV